MSANTISARQATLTRLSSLAGGRVFQGSIDEEGTGYDIPRDSAGRTKPHIVVDWLTPTPSRRDRVLGLGEKGQPHSLYGSFACIAGSASDAEALMGAVFDSLIDWRPETDADPYDAQGGFRERIERKSNTVPERFIEMLYLGTVVCN